MIEGVRALTFDTYGTLVDWRSSVAREARAALQPLGIALDWHAFADAWRAQYQPAMDEVRSGRRPFSALDVQTRTMMEDELLHLWSSLSASVVFVTHDLEEAISLADRVCVLTSGPGSVKGIYTIDLPRPRNVAEIRFEPRFVQLYHEIWEDLRNEVMISYERTKQRV